MEDDKPKRRHSQTKKNKWQNHEHTVIHINDGFCWLCGIERSKTYHHAIPKKYKARNNVHIPLCFKCHRRIHKEGI